MKKLTVFAVCLLQVFICQGQLVTPLYGVREIRFKGSDYMATDNPVRDIVLLTTWRYESGDPEIKIYGFYDGNGEGKAGGNVFKTRFCPTKTGLWELIKVTSNDEKLDGQNEGLKIRCVDSENKGFWETDAKKGNRWYKRSDGSHPYFIGNTFYSFLSEYINGKPTGGSIKKDVIGNSKYMNKLRFAVTGDIYPNPKVKPFLDNEGEETDDGAFSYRPNPKWFSERVDLAVRLCYEQDVIADIILNGPDSENARNALHPGGNDFNYTPYLRYIAARYGSYPNVWICLSNEFNIRKPKFTAEEIVTIGSEMKEFLPYTTPISVHGDQGEWNEKLNKGDWNDHIIIQNKIKYLDNAADFNLLNYWIGNRKPVINDELAYEGKGDGWSEEDVIEAVLGAFMGGGYASSGYKPFGKGGHYFAGNFSPEEYTAADNLLWFRQVIDQHIDFWEMKPAFVTDATYKKGVGSSRSSIFYQMDKDSRAMEWPGHQYVLACNKAKDHILAYLPEGDWEISMFDLIAKKHNLLAANARGVFEFSAPDSRAVLFVFRRK